MLKTGDPCPCCGQPIKTNDPEILEIMTYIQERGVNLETYLEFLDVKRGGANTCPFIVEDE